MIGEIITIGTEVVTGKTINTNAAYLARELSQLGVDMYYSMSVDDDPKRLEKVIKSSLERSDLIITSGGLGPTKDDLTRDVIAKALGLKMIKDQIMLDHIASLFKKMGRPLTKNNISQAYRPEGSKFLKNEIGTAPGILINKDNKIVIMLPGPPRELKPMFKKQVIPLIKPENNILTKSINTIGIGESLLETKILDMNLKLNFTDISTFAKDGRVEIRLTAEGPDKNLLMDEINKILEVFKRNLKEYIYGYSNISIEEVLIEKLKYKDYKVGFCESCTGGLVSSKLTKIPGASQVFDRSIISYSNQAKIDLLGVKPETLDKKGAVSRETAFEMAKGMVDKYPVDIAASITGIAGPKSDDSKKPIGLVYVCVMTKDTYHVEECNFYGDRDTIQERSAIKTFELLWKMLENSY